jgi:AAA+ superfamily predicted ATPase
LAVFLQELEYFQGVLVLTTNRMGTLDAAFKSRIHLSLAYEPLTESARRQIWSKLLDQISQHKHDISAEDVVALGSAALNGRDIKNLIRTALLFAQAKGKPLSREHINVVLAAQVKSLV